LQVEKTKTNNYHRSETILNYYLYGEQW